jgi:UDP-2,3-diacylglucosamine hydrolase
MNFAELAAPSTWRSIEFISDVHLQENEPANFLAWRAYLEQTQADAVFILGDLFELWVGDDALSTPQDSNLIARHEGLHFEDRCCRVLHYLAERCPVYFMPGNRDFLVGERFLTACGMRALQDPTVLSFGGERFLLTHGDVLCSSDKEYQAFRQQVRSEAWQTEFLATPLQERMQRGRMMRQESQARHQKKPDYAQVDEALLQDWVRQSKSTQVIHGHTHEGLSHALAGQAKRHVLSDWHVNHKPARGDALRLKITGDKTQIERIATAS